MEELEEYCTASLDVIEQVIHSVMTEFVGVTTDRQQELIDLCYQVLEYAVLLEVVFPPCQELVEHLRTLTREMSSSVEQSLVVASRGRPRIKIGQEQLEYLVESQFRIKDIATLFNCSTRTVKRMRELCISPTSYTAISDDELDNITCAITSAYPQCGEKLVSGRLRSQGIHVQRQRVRDSLHRVDPRGVERRRRSVTQKRVQC